MRVEETEKPAWTLADGGMSVITEAAARTGIRGLRVTDTSDKKGSNCRSAPVPITAGKTYALSFWGRVLEGDGAVGVYIQFADTDRRVLTSPSATRDHPGHSGRQGRWHAFTLCGRAPPESAMIVGLGHSFVASRGIADVDDFALTSERGRGRKMRIGIACVHRGAVSRRPILRASRRSPLGSRPRRTVLDVLPPIASMDRLAALPEAAACC